jgi:hypothetical protein
MAAGRTHPAIALARRSKALVAAVRPIFGRLKIEAIPRNWLFLSAA